MIFMPYVLSYGNIEKSRKREEMVVITHKAMGVGKGTYVPKVGLRMMSD